MLQNGVDYHDLGPRDFDRRERTMTVNGWSAEVATSGGVPNHWARRLAPS